MIKAIIFDMDGLMFDTEQLSKKIMKYVGKKNGYEFDDALFDKLIGSSSQTIMKIFKKKFGNDFPYYKIIKEKNKIMKREIKEKGVPIKYGLKESLNFLDKNNIVKAVASSSSKQTIKFYLESANLEDEFDFIIGGNEVKESKPNPEIFTQCCNRININKENILILEDSINGIIAANKADIDVILIQDIVEIPNKVRKLAYEELKHLADLPKLIAEINK